MFSLIRQRRAASAAMMLVPMILAIPLTGCGSAAGVSANPPPAPTVVAAVTAPASKPPLPVPAPVAPAPKPVAPVAPVKPVAPTPAPVAPAPVTTPVKKSISAWVVCDGLADDRQGVANAFQAASHNAFTLVVDCPVRIPIGMDIARTIFIDNGTTIEFAGAGKFTVDNVLLPAFVIANSNDITLTDWNLEYNASLPVDWNVAGYTAAGRWIAQAGYAQPSFASTNLSIGPWLTANRGVVFDHSQGNVGSLWRGPTNASAVFFITGDSGNLTVTGMRIYAPAAAGGERFIPVAFSLTPNYKSNQTVTANTPYLAQYFAVPHNMVFSNIELDGTYMGWQGNVQNAVFTNIRSHRYGDLQDASGGNVGGVGKWFAPPHLLYLNYTTAGDPALFNRHIQITDVVDDGPRIGIARDKGGTDTISGYALSLKIGCVDCAVDRYLTTRPDGFLDVLTAAGLTISNVTATYDSSFINNLFPGWRFVGVDYNGVIFKNIVLTDAAASTVQPPLGNAFQPNNVGVVLQNVQVNMTQWSGLIPVLPEIFGVGNNVALDYSMGAGASRLMSSQVGTVIMTLQATPAIIPTGGTTLLTWTSTNATACTASGAWVVLLGTGGSLAVSLSRAGGAEFTLTCRNANDVATVTMPVVAR